MEYDPEAIAPIQGAFYASTAYQDVNFNYFREEEDLDLDVLLKPEDDAMENFVLRDTNYIVVKTNPEFLTNKNPKSPTNRLLTSLFSRGRMAFLLKYGIAYVEEKNGLEKHIMRYPQIFATKAIEQRIDKGIKKGIIWHTQGSGKTALAYYNVPHLTDYFQKKNVIPKFYFIVDRIDLLNQAKTEFSNRGLIVHTVNSKEELIRDFKKQQAVHNFSGQREITVVNIQKFNDETTLLKSTDYDINVQRVYFLDEVHRSYNPAGSFLANLLTSDRNAILIGLTGTPLIGDDRKSKDTFGGYIHKYYYNASIADGYTLKLIREGIETKYKLQLEQALKDIKMLKGDIKKGELYAHKKFAEPMLDYIVEDFAQSRLRLFNDSSVGAMVVCDSSEQALMLFEVFKEKYAVQPIGTVAEENLGYGMAAEPAPTYGTPKLKKQLSAALILDKVGTKESRKQEIKDFKEGAIDFLFVYNMLLTGFDAKRLKKLYIGRIVKDHNLLQTLTRVNRPYKNFQYGYVVDFADISKEFEATNKAYFDELQEQLGDEMESYSNLFKSKVEMEAEIKDIKEKLFHFDLLNSEVFSQQISEIQDPKTLLEIKKALAQTKDLYNIIRMYGHFDLLEVIDFRKLNELYNRTSERLNLVNQKNALQNSGDTSNLLNVALENMIFMFRKVSEAEMVIADQLKETLRKTRETLLNNFDQQDPYFISLREELERLFKKKNLNEITQKDMEDNIKSLRLIYDKVTELNRKNNLLKAKYGDDTKYARLHKRVVEHGNITKRESDIHEALTNIKIEADDKVHINSRQLDNENYFSSLMMGIVLKNFKKVNPQLEPDSAKYVNKYVVREYMNEFHGVYM
jgi:type I restriction enzyme, R subunit